MRVRMGHNIGHKTLKSVDSDSVLKSGDHIMAHKNLLTLRQAAPRPAPAEAIEAAADPVRPTSGHCVPGYK